MGKNWDLKISPAVLKTLKKMPRNYAERIFLIIKELPLDPFLGDIQKIKGEENVWRRRIGAYRLSYEIDLDKKIIYVFWVQRRSTNTYRKK